MRVASMPNRTLRRQDQTRYSTASRPRRLDALRKSGWLIGAADHGILVVVFTIRQPGNVYRLISARRASRKERKVYEEAKRVPL